MARLKKATKARPKTRWAELNDRRAELSAAGDVESLWEVVSTAPWSMVDLEDVFRLILAALEVRARRDPEAFADEILARMATFTTLFLMRSHYILDLSVKAHGTVARSKGPSHLSQNIHEVHIPRIVGIQAHLIEILMARACIGRQYELTRSKRIRNDRARRSKPKKAGLGTNETTTPCACKELHGRDGELLDSLGNRLNRTGRNGSGGARDE